jgi:hypothetical protein
MELSAGRKRIVTMLERVQTERGSYLAVGKAQRTKILHPIHAGAGTDIGANEPTGHKQRPQVMWLPGFDLQRSELHDRLWEIDDSRQFGYDVDNQLLCQWG